MPVISARISMPFCAFLIFLDSQSTYEYRFGPTGGQHQRDETTTPISCLIDSSTLYIDILYYRIRKEIPVRLPIIAIAALIGYGSLAAVEVQDKGNEGTRGNKGTLFLTILIMTLSFLNLMFTPALLFGMAETMNQQSIENIFGNIIIEPEEDETYIKRVSSLQNEVKNIPGVIGSSAHYR